MPGAQAPGTLAGDGDGDGAHAWARLCGFDANLNKTCGQAATTGPEPRTAAQRPSQTDLDPTTPRRRPGDGTVLFMSPPSDAEC